MKIDKLVVATGNKYKVAEINLWFQPHGVEVLPLSQGEMPPETGTSFLENARIKAQYGFEVMGLPTLADDSGLEVDALAGAPGIYSSRYAGDNASDADNNHKLLQQMAGKEQRSAAFQCAMVVVTAGEIVEVQGTCLGEILTDPQGQGGFGYDPLFWLEEFKCSMAELSLEQKNKISHRARALDKLVQQLISRGLL